MESETATSDSELRAQAADNTLAANPLIGVRQEDIMESAAVLFQRIMANPGLAATQYAAFLGELGRIASGRSDLLHSSDVQSTLVLRTRPTIPIAKREPPPKRSPE